jgi:hypothetical protein
MECRGPAGIPASAGHLHRLADRFRCTADQVVVGTHAYGTAQLLLHMQHKGKLQYLSDECWPITRCASLELCLRP